DGTVDFTYNSSSSPTLAGICVRDDNGVPSTHLVACGADPANCAAGSSTVCTFTRTVSGLDVGDSRIDQACVSGTDSNGNPVSKCATASVSADDVKPTATVTKKFDSNLCTIVRYSVQVDNTDAVESLTLTALTDDTYGDITSVHDNIVATTCA